MQHTAVFELRHLLRDPHEEIVCRGNDASHDGKRHGEVFQRGTRLARPRGSLALVAGELA